MLSNLATIASIVVIVGLLYMIWRQYDDISRLNLIVQRQANEIVALKQQIEIRAIFGSPEELFMPHNIPEDDNDSVVSSSRTPSPTPVKEPVEEQEQNTNVIVLDEPVHVPTKQLAATSPPEPAEPVQEAAEPEPVQEAEPAEPAEPVQEAEPAEPVVDVVMNVDTVPVRKNTRGSSKKRLVL